MIWDIAFIAPETLCFFQDKAFLPGIFGPIGNLQAVSFEGNVVGRRWRMRNKKTEKFSMFLFAIFNSASFFLVEQLPWTFTLCLFFLEGKEGL